jgi:hypothetical protein
MRCKTRPVADLPPPQHSGNDLGLIEHPAPNVEPGDVGVLADSREVLVSARVESQPGSSRRAGLSES